MVEASLEDPTESDTVVRFLDTSAEVETSYGGNFVDSIDGFEGSTSSGAEADWFFFVNGYYSDVGAGETPIRPGDRIWWDYRYWSAAYRVPAVVGSWPEPFLHGDEGGGHPTVVQCVDAAPAECGAVAGALEGAGADVSVEEPGRPEPSPDELRVLVGPWDSLRSDSAARRLEDGPARSGVYAELVECGDGWAIEPTDDRGRGLGPVASAGLIAAVREGREQPTWVVTGTDPGALSAASASLNDQTLADRYAVLIEDDESRPLPSDGAAANPGARCR